MRPTTWMKCAPRCSVMGESPGASTRASCATVTHSSAGGDDTGKLKRGGVTPTIVKLRPLTVSALPTGFAAPPR